MAQLNEEVVKQALKVVYDPDLNQDLVTLGMIQNMEILGSKVRFKVVLTTPACPMKAKLEAECREAVQKIDGVDSVEIEMTSEVKKARVPTSGMKPIPGVSHVIAVSSGKGGVGKSTVAVNLACALSKEGARVGILDADVYGPNVPTMMGVIDEPQIRKDPERGEVFLPPEVQGIKVMSMAFLVPPEQPVIWRGPMLHSIVNQFCYQVDWGTLDYLVVDMPPGTGDVQLSLAQLAPISGAVLVTTPQEVSLQDVRKAYRMFEKVNVPVLGIVENMSYFQCGKCDEKHDLFGGGGGAKLASQYELQVLAELPLVPKVRQGGDQGRPITLADSESETSQLFRGLARLTAQRISILQARMNQKPIQIGSFN